jgi:hypothetical protein
MIVIGKNGSWCPPSMIWQASVCVRSTSVRSHVGAFEQNHRNIKLRAPSAALVIDGRSIAMESRTQMCRGYAMTTLDRSASRDDHGPGPAQRLALVYANESRRAWLAAGLI